MESAADRRLFWGTAIAVVAADFVTKLIAEAMLALRVIAGRHPVCPRCFCELVVDHLEFLAEQLDHKQPLPAVEDTIGETQGNA